MSRDVPFEQSSVCESCGVHGAYDFMGDVLCSACAFPEPLAPLCPDSPDGNHHTAPIGSDEEWMPSKAPCYYCGDKQVDLNAVQSAPGGEE